MKNYIIILTLCLTVILSLSCSDNWLEEKPLDFLNSSVILVDEAGFESALTGLYQAVRSEIPNDALEGYYCMNLGTDFCCPGPIGIQDFRNYQVSLNPHSKDILMYWDWAYLKVLPRANSIIEFAENPKIKWKTDKSKNQVIAEARFMRAYTYNILANLFGGVPIVDKVEREPRFDYVRATRENVLNFVKEDLCFASDHLADLPTLEGRLPKAAADHLLCEVYISLGEPKKAIESASRVINSGLYHLMTERFGSTKDKPGNAFLDMFLDGNQSRQSGNKELIWAYQIEYETPGGFWNNWLRKYAPKWWSIKDPDGKGGMIVRDSIGRGIGQCRPNTYVFHGLFDDKNDIRNSEDCIKRNWWYNDPKSKYCGQKVDFSTAIYDSMVVYPMIMKVSGIVRDGHTGGKTYNDIPIFRLAETYLLRAEAHLLNKDKVSAAADINIVRARANAKPVQPEKVDIDYILDERMRELMVEERRRMTLVRTGKLVERVKKYNMLQETRETIEDYHLWWPIPQSAIDANSGVVLEQNPGY